MPQSLLQRNRHAVAKANEQKATTEQALTVITAAYDAVAGKYSDGDEEKRL